MRAFITALLVCLGPFAALQLDRADDKGEKERRDKLEKELAELDARCEKLGWAVPGRKIIAEMTGHLDNADRIDVVRLDPGPLPDENKGKREFHGYAVLSELRLQTKVQRNEAAAFLGKTLHWNDARRGLCFNPRHGLRAVSGERTLDFLICFECWRVEVFEGGKDLTSLPLGLTDKNNPIERLLAENDKNAEERK